MEPEKNVAMPEENLPATEPDMESKPKSREDFMSAFEVADEEEKGSNNKPSGDADPMQPTKSESPNEWEMRYRDLQSKYDKLYHTNEQVVTEYQEALNAKQFLTQLMEDEETFEAFVYEKKPELINRKDISSIMEEKLQAEFGEFRPSKDDTSPQALLYFKRFDELYESMKSQNKAPKTLKELQAVREREKKTQEESLTKEMQRAQKVMNWEDTTVENFQKWAKNLQVVDLMKMYNFALKTQRIPSASQMSGTARRPKTARESFLRDI